jgi:hypothetical protein
MDDFSYLDSQIVSEFKMAAVLQIRPKDGMKVLKLLNIYCYLYDIDLKYLSFKNQNNKKMLSDFLQFCCSDFFGYTLKYKQVIRNYLTRIIYHLNISRTVLLELDTSKPL